MYLPGSERNDVTVTIRDDAYDAACLRHGSGRPAERVTWSSATRRLIIEGERVAA